MTEVCLSSAVLCSIVDDIDSKSGQKPGAIEFIKPSDGDKTGRKFSGLIYRCPCGCGSQGFLALRPMSPEEEQHPSWQWDGNEKMPNLDPSINHVGHWHGFLERGFFVQKRGQNDGQARSQATPQSNSESERSKED